MESLIARFRSHDACVGVIGLGYVGLPLVCQLLMDTRGVGT